jgi:HME family heavy-metal exporter
MTALTAALALVPLLFAAEAPGKEILHPVAVVIFGGLVSSTLLDVLLTPLLFRRYGGPALASIDSDSSQGDTP